jgi:hypothetical protein
MRRREAEDDEKEEMNAEEARAGLFIY